MEIAEDVLRRTDLKCILDSSKSESLLHEAISLIESPEFCLAWRWINIADVFQIEACRCTASSTLN